MSAVVPFPICAQFGTSVEVVLWGILSQGGLHTIEGTLAVVWLLETNVERLIENTKGNNYERQ
jgi:hypothetical protein